MMRRLLLLAAVLALAGCGNLGYYWNSVGGQLEIWQREAPIERLLADPALDPKTKAQLERALRIRDYASRELGLPDNRSYRSYADLARPFVVWNVFAAEEFSTDPPQWCFPFAGCVGYRGYFSETEARTHAATLAAEGYDVHVGGVPAYSTIGWFADPVLNTFVNYPETELARLLFHELAHQQFYLGGDTRFNESFAVAVEHEGVQRWLRREGTPGQLQQYESFQSRRREFIALVLAYRTRLEALYRQNIAVADMRRRKAETLVAMRADYEALKASPAWGGFAGYDRFFTQNPNNAHLASVAVYSELVPGFQALLQGQGGDLPKFYKVVRDLAGLPKTERDARLGAVGAP